GDVKPDGNGKYGEWLLPRTTALRRGTRLTEAQLDELRFGEMLSPAERDVFTEMLFRREQALAWDFEEKGLILDEIEPPHVIRTKPHEPWTDRAFRTPRKLLEEEKRIVTERQKLGLFERSWGPYRNATFLVPKKNGKYRFIISCVKANQVTLRDAGLPPNVEGFAESFAGYPICSMCDFFAGYEQVSL